MTGIQWVFNQEELDLFKINWDLIAAQYEQIILKKAA
jgi:hypothetical protein